MADWAQYFVPLLWRLTSCRIYFMSRRQRNAAELNSGNAVDPSAPVLNQPTGPKPPVESRRLSPVQHKRGREFEGGAFISAGGAVPSPSFEEDEISRLAEFFLLLDAWDRRRNGSPVM
jgi:hypothetical protein